MKKTISVLVILLAATAVNAKDDQWKGRECVDNNIPIDNFSTVLVRDMPSQATYDCSVGEKVTLPQNGLVYRGHRLENTEQAKALASLGVRTVLSLESKKGLMEEVELLKQANPDKTIRVVVDEGSEVPVAKANEIIVLNVEMPDMGRPSPESVQRALNIAKKSEIYPLYVNCHRGADRTGLVIGLLRMARSAADPTHAWTAKEIIEEQQNFRRSGSGMQGAFKALPNYVVGKKGFEVDLAK